MSSIPGNPQKVVEDYINAIRNGDFKTVYRLNRVSARQKKFIEKSGAGNSKNESSQNFAKHKAAYESLKPGFFTGAQWAEKYFFPKSSTVTVGDPRHPPKAGGEASNAGYEQGLSIIVSVKTVYNMKKEAPELNARRIKEATYDCFLAKIRYGDNVQIYSYDEQWFFAGCILDTRLVLFFES